LHLYSKFAYNFVDNIHKNRYTKFKRRFEFRYLNKEQFDAFAHIKRFNLDSVYINYGSILLIHDLFYKLLSNPTVFPQLGGKQDNELSEEILKFRPFIKNKTIYFLMPQDILRREIAQICSTIAVQFIILHEIGHHMNGHTILQKKKTLSEKDRKTLEMDADSFAVTSSIQAAFLTSEHRMNYFTNLSLTNLDYIKLWIYIIHIVFLFIGNEEEYLEVNRNKRRYLPRRIRSLLAAQISIELFQRFFPDEQHDFKSMFVESAKLAEIDYNSTFKTKSSQEEILSCFSEELFNHLNEINRHWDNVIGPLLEPYARVPLFKS